MVLVGHVHGGLVFKSFLRLRQFGMVINYLHQSRPRYNIDQHVGFKFRFQTYNSKSIISKEIPWLVLVATDFSGPPSTSCEVDTTSSQILSDRLGWSAILVLHSLAALPGPTFLISIQITFSVLIVIWVPHMIRI